MSHGFTCNGFTRGARKYAKHKGIKLIIICTYDENKDRPYISTINLDLNFITRGQPEISLSLPDEAAVAKFNRDLQTAGLHPRLRKGDPIYINSQDSRLQLHDFLQLKLDERDDRQAGTVEVDVDVSDLTIEVEDRGPLPIDAMSAKYEIGVEKSSIVIATLIAELVVRGLGDDDLLIFDEDLTRHQIDPETGEVKQEPRSLGDYI